MTWNFLECGTVLSGKMNETTRCSCAKVARIRNEMIRSTEFSVQSHQSKFYSWAISLMQMHLIVFFVPLLHIALDRTSVSILFSAHTLTRNHIYRRVEWLANNSYKWSLPPYFLRCLIRIDFKTQKKKRKMYANDMNFGTEDRDDLCVMSIERLVGKSEYRLAKPMRKHSVLN